MTYESVLGKGEIVRNKQFLLFPVFSTCLDKFLSFSSNLKLLSANSLTLSQTSPGFHVSAVLAFGKHCGKRRNCSKRAISPFSTVFSTHLENFLPFLSNLKLSSANTLDLEESKTCRLGEG